MGTASGQKDIKEIYGLKMMKKWYHIKHTHPVIGIIRFWLHQENEDDIRKLVIKKGYTDIEWIKQEIPAFISK